MQRTRRAVKRTPIIEGSSDSEDEIPLKRLHESQLKKKTSNKDDSSSESDIENYLQPIDKLDLNSSFFNTQKKSEAEFNKIEKNIFAGVTRLSDSDSDEDMNETKTTLQESTQILSQTDLAKPSTSSTTMKLNFQQLEEYTKKIEETKKHVEQYNAKKKAEEQMDISNLLAAGEVKNLTLENIKPEDLHSSDFESCDSEQEDWEEVKIKEIQETKEKRLVPKDGVQITVNMPDTCRKKKGVDLLAAMKRRLNRIRKENQVYVHKVHLLCWIAHGNYINETINNTQILGLALSLLPSDKCYPSDRTDLSYLEQIVQWYKRTIKLSEKLVPKDLTLISALQVQINRKEVYNKKMLVYIFVAMLRALGIQCRLVVSFQVEPLRPPASELHSLANDAIKKESKPNDKAKKSTSTSKVAEMKSENKDTDKKKEKKSSNKKESSDKVDSMQKDQIIGNAVDEKGKSQNNRYITRKRKESEQKEEPKKTETGEKELDNKKKSTTVRSRNTVKTQNTKAEKVPDKESTESRKKENITLNKRAKGSNSKATTDEKINESSKDKDKKTSTKKSLEINQEKSKVSESNKLAVQKEKNSRSKSAETKTKPESSKKNETLTVDNTRTTRSKSEDTSQEKRTRSKTTAKKEVIKVKFPKKEKVVPQLDGTNISSDEDTSFNSVFTSGIPQLDGADDVKSKKVSKTKKPNLKKLNVPLENKCEKKTHPSRLTTAVDGYSSENEFKPRSPFTKKNTESPKELSNRKVNLHKLKTKDKVQSPGSSPKKQLDVKNDIVSLIKGRIAEQKHVDRSRMVKKRKPSYKDDSDSDYMLEPVKKKHHDSDSELEYFVPKPKVKQRISFRKIKEQKVLSSDSETEKSGKKKKKGIDVWVEVFLENEEKWISVDLVYGQVHCVNELYNRATHPVTYTVAWNNDNCLKDITMRYCKSFNTITRKLRVEAKWWEETLEPFRAAYTAREKEEDDDLNRQQLDQPMPKSIAEYKNHPLYALRRHLLKFEEIYPPDLQPLGYVRKEPVYPRNCVYVCRSRDIWLKEARVVKPGEKPYKIVKARPKYDKLSNTVITDQLLEIFGIWQTMDYEPPTAENGVVPRNAFGNVELFKSCMLPKGTAHLKLPGLNKICRRMNIDCASAIVGFDFHGGWSHPTYDGFVVCEEYADTLVAAWELEQEEMERKENEKIEKRVYGNWRKLIKGLLIRERLKAKYNFGNTSAEGGGAKKKAKGPRLCTKKRRMYSDSESESDNT